MKAQAIPTTIKLLPDVREQLQAWAASNLTNMSAEIARAVRERRERERQEQKAA